MAHPRAIARATRAAERLEASATDPDRYFAGVADLLEDHGVPFVGVCWHLTDPATGLITWTGHRGTLPGDLLSAFENEFLEEDAAKYAEVARRPTPVAALVTETGGRPSGSARYRRDLAPHGFADELRIVFTDPFGRWGSMGLFTDEVYSPGEQALAAALVPPVAHALRQAVARAGLAAPEAPGIIVLDREDRVRTYDNRAAELLATAVRTGALPGAVHILAARARGGDGAASGRTLAGDGAWIELNASTLHDGSVALVLRPSPPASLIDLRLRAAGLTAREREIARHLMRGESTAMIAAALHLSPWTVQDHLKAMFDKTGVRSRRAFVARWALEAVAVSA